jgi:peptidoglycan/LPS O-acetylase OafA/YrhL
LLLVDLREIELIATTEIIEVLSFCFYSVDIFFWVGGFFVGFVLTETKKINFFREKGIFAIFQLFFMRLLRLWPIYIFTIFTFWKLMPQIGKGPRWIGAAGVSC